MLTGIYIQYVLEGAMCVDWYIQYVLEGAMYVKTRLY